MHCKIQQLTWRMQQHAFKNLDYANDIAPYPITINRHGKPFNTAVITEYLSSCLLIQHDMLTEKTCIALHCQ